MVVDKASYTRCISSCIRSSAIRSLMALIASAIAYQRKRKLRVSLMFRSLLSNRPGIDLVDSGIIVSQRGTGSVVNALPEGVSYGHTFRGITSDLSFSQIRIENQILMVAPRSAKEALLDGLNLPAKNKYLFISRVRYAKGKPFNHEKIYINLSFFPRFAAGARGFGTAIVISVAGKPLSDHHRFCGGED
ncbi:DNA-binding transcriptional repressor MngR [Serratia fonticola]|uniref:DNA-binding transcriptional repressor MngR n=1 Tax=Serratia fonticola TaxID=47917 RepID=A0A4U9VCJ8_SERFO|nr:DNA-binding transcriptional repressor MngR [Serratia fonticola]